MNTLLHLGLGSFHRAHQAVYIHQLHELGDTRWSIAAGNLRDDMQGTIAALQAQGGAYTLETITPAGERAYSRIASITRVVAYQEDLADLQSIAADPSTRIISFTVTEAGYYLDAKNKLDWATFADLRADLEAVKSGQAGHTIYGGLVSLLRARSLANAGPVTLLNCDNLRHNGDRSRGGLLAFIQAVGDSALLAWVQKNTTSPNAMVDRITPRPTPDVAERVFAATGATDPAAVMSESFIQWVIEENFIAGRPEWEKVGVEMVYSVQAHEEAKIRLLNATHSCIAWAGTLAGFQYIHEGSQHSAIRQMAYNYATDDAIAVLQPSPINLAAYRDVVLDRFANPAIADTNQRVAMDAFSKIPGMIAPTIADKLKRQGSTSTSIKSVAMLPALFLAYLQRWHVAQLPYTYQDQAMDEATAHAICTANDPVAAFAADPTLWGELANDPRLVQALREATARVHEFVRTFEH
jgi:D-arabinitol 4-dehydrogenase